MKKTGVLNQPISAVIASLGHKDSLVIADAGLPIPSNVNRIDLALTEGIPCFLDALRAVLIEMQVEEAVIAEEMLEVSSHIHKEIKKILGDTPINIVSHETLKELTRSSRAVIRTGEFTPYANIILVSGVIF